MRTCIRCHSNLHFLVLFVVLYYFPGTTGRPKGVSLSHTALNVQSRAKITEVGYSSNDVCFSCLNKSGNCSLTYRKTCN